MIISGAITERINEFAAMKRSANIFESLGELISPKPAEMECKEILKILKSRTRTSLH